MKNAIMKGASILTVIFMISMVFTPLATAAPIQPDQRFGVAYESDTVTEIDSENVLGFIDGVQYGVAVTDGYIFGIGCNLLWFYQHLPYSTPDSTPRIRYIAFVFSGLAGIFNI